MDAKSFIEDNNLQKIDFNTLKKIKETFFINNKDLETVIHDEINSEYFISKNDNIVSIEFKKNLCLYDSNDINSFVCKESDSVIIIKNFQFNYNNSKPFSFSYEQEIHYFYSEEQIKILSSNNIKNNQVDYNKPHIMQHYICYENDILFLSTTTVKTIYDILSIETMLFSQRKSDEILLQAEFDDVNSAITHHKDVLLKLQCNNEYIESLYENEDE